uniref:Uncharacterized protein n=1 Tax=Anguilla anguilla TaxID=7936 RepID=A0A0E9T1Q6_ANGAN
MAKVAQIVLFLTHDFALFLNNSNLIVHKQHVKQ